MALYDYLDKYTPQYLLKSALSLVSNTVDKREGSVIYDTLSPLATTASALLGYLKTCLLQTDVETATGEFLDMITSERGVYRHAAVAAQKIIQVTPSSVVLSEGATMKSAGLGLIWEVTEVLDEGRHTVICQTAGTDGGSDYGELALTNPVDGVQSVTFSEPVFDGKDEETDAELRIRFWQKIGQQSYGGNFDSYKTWCFVDYLNATGIALDGIQFFPATRYAGGGHILIRPTVTDGDDLYVPASDEAVSRLKAYLDPVDNEGLGAGVAPVGHRVTVESIFPSVRNLNIQVKNYNRTIKPEQISEAIADLRSEFSRIRKALVSALVDGFPTDGYSAQLLQSRINAAILGIQEDRFEDVVSITYGDGSYGEDGGHALDDTPLADETIIVEATGTPVYLPVLGTINFELVEG